MAQISRTKQAAYLVFGGGLSQVSGILTSLIFVRTLQPADYGTYRQVLLVSTLIVPIFSSAFPNSLLYFLPRLKTEEEKAAFAKRTILILMALGGLTSVVMAGFSGLVAGQFNNAGLDKYLLLGCLYPAFTLGSSFLVPLMISVGQARLSAIYSSVTSFVNLSLVAIVAVMIGSVGAIVISIVCSAFLAFLFAVFLSNRYLNIFTKQRTQIPMREQIIYAIPLGLASVVSIWGYKLDQAIVSSYFDVSTYAVYSVGAMEFPLVGLLSSSIYAVLLPEVSKLMAEGKKGEVLQLWQRTVEKAMLLIMPLFGASMIMSYQLITILYTKKYEASVPIFQIYLLLIPIRTISFGLLLRAAGKTKYDFYGSILFLASNFLLAVSTVKLLGIYGPAISMVVSVYLLATYLSFSVKREIGFSFIELLNLKAFGSILLISVLPVGILEIFAASFSLKGMLSSAISLCIYIVLILSFYKSSGKWSKLQLRKA